MKIASYIISLAADSSWTRRSPFSHKIGSENVIIGSFLRLRLASVIKLEYRLYWVDN